MDLLEKFITENRTAFDTEATPQSFWTKVEDELCALKKTDIEDFIGGNRESLDTEFPSPDLWKKIDKSLVRAEKIKNTPSITASIWPRHLMRIAAAVLLLVGGIGIGMQLSQASNSQQELAGLTLEQEQALNVFERDVQVKMQKAATFVNQSPEIKADLASLDQAALELKNDLKDVPPGNREQVVHAMLENYKAKVHILERILKFNSENELQNNDRFKSEKHERKEI